VWNVVKPRGGFILCFYDGGLAEIDKRIRKLQEHFRTLDGTLVSAYGSGKLTKV
jgi:hypothetical protein